MWTIQIVPFAAIPVKAVSDAKPGKAKPKNEHQGRMSLYVDGLSVHALILKQEMLVVAIVETTYFLAILTTFSGRIAGTNDPKIPFGQHPQPGLLGLIGAFPGLSWPLCGVFFDVTTPLSSCAKICARVRVRSSAAIPRDFPPSDQNPVGLMLGCFLVLFVSSFVSEKREIS